MTKSARGQPLPEHFEAALILGAIASGEWRDPVEAIRAAYLEAEVECHHADPVARKKAIKAAVAESKKALCGVIFAGTFSTRGDAGIVTYSGILCADLDDLDPETLGKAFALASRDAMVWGAFRSPTGTGLKLLFRVATPASQHLAAFQAVRAYVRDHYGLPIDEACKNLERLCFVSYDPAAFWRDATVLPVAVDPPKPAPTFTAAKAGRAAIVASLLGSVTWKTADVEGFVQCPGQHLHTQSSGPRDCILYLATVPTIKCAHNSCAGIVAGVNHELRSRIARAESGPSLTIGGQPIRTSTRAGGARHDYLPGEEEDAPQPEASPTPTARPLAALSRPKHGEDPDELLKDRYLCRKGGLLIVAPTGVGKSSFAMQAMIQWSLGREMFGIMPTRPLKSLLIQAENDDGDPAEMRDGVAQGLNLPFADWTMAMNSIHVATEDARAGLLFITQTVRALLETHRPDLLWLDPILAYLGGESSAQKDVGPFLRQMLNPLLREFNCAAVVIHHTNKPPAGKEKQDWQAGDFAYLGSGSAEWANWARAVIGIRSVGKHDVFELRAGKRGPRLKWKEQDGETPTCARMIAHAREPGVIYWRDAEESEGKIEDKTPAQKGHDPEAVLAYVPTDKAIAKNTLISRVNLRAGIAINHAKVIIGDLVDEGRLFVWLIERKGTRAEVFLSRSKQPEKDMI